MQTAVTTAMIPHSDGKGFEMTPGTNVCGKSGGGIIIRISTAAGGQECVFR
jgi:hypothetical protein